LGELVELEGELAGAELEGVEPEDDDDEGELLQPATSPAITASTEPAVTICLSFMVWLPFRIEGGRRARCRRLCGLLDRDGLDGRLGRL
jgi:hypothetical protein